MGIRVHLWAFGLTLAVMTAAGTQAKGQSVTQRGNTFIPETGPSSAERVTNSIEDDLSKGKTPLGQAIADEPGEIKPAIGAAPVHAKPEPDEVIPEAPLSPSEIRRLPHVRETYLNAFRILSENNTCSQFFGGPAPAVEVLNEFTRRLKISYFEDRRIGIKMSGKTEDMLDAHTKVSYRLFEKVEVNGNGPFFKRKNYSWESLVPKVNIFQPATREARVLILLHELGHMMKGPDGRWLLPNDGGNEVQSDINTATIMAKCKSQIVASEQGAQ